MQEVFLDTTLQIDRYYSPEKDRILIQQKLENKRLISSTYVLGEFVAAFIKDAITYHKLLSDEAILSPIEALVELQKYSLNSIRIYNRILKLLSNIQKDINDKEAVKYRIEMFIEKLFIARFESGLDEIIDDTNCVRANPVIVKKFGIYSLDHGCSQKKKPACDIVSFYSQNKAALNNIITNGEPEDIVAKLQEIEKGKNVIGRRCWGIGDAVIALEVPNNTILYTTNIKDYKPICSSISKPYFNPKST
ncbi:hypothetical protein QMA40_21065 [Bacillus thuringiensis]|uniref:hypothetical protein n=1 Tax=Bacillus thuringiensis TaxID=1428 RepID=UPI003977A17E